MVNYITVCDRNYLPKALALYESMKTHSKDDFGFHLFYIGYDCPDIPFPQEELQIHIINDIEQLKFTELLRDNRTYGEYCWSLASICTRYAMDCIGLSPYVYLDSDLFFYNDPKIVLDYIGDKSVAVVPHNFLPEDIGRLLPNGLFNVSYVYFKGDNESRDILNNWTYQVITKCRSESGCMGDQSYLDEWPDILNENLSVLTDGMGNGPWHIRAYAVSHNDYLDPFIKRDGNLEWSSLIFYHFHEHHRTGKERTGYLLNESVIKYIYEPYEKVLEKYERR
jgi:hypothetical protein